jgi:hypothetical protein
MVDSKALETSPTLPVPHFSRADIFLFLDVSFLYKEQCIMTLKKYLIYDL